MPLNRSCGVLALTVVLFGCGTEGRIEFIDGGSGPEGKNLDPVQLGTVRSNFGSVVSGRTQAAGYDGLREHEFVADSSETLISTAKGSLATSVGSPKEAVLRVPASVRVGMAWNAYVEGSEKPIATFAVTERKTDVDTIFGKATVWTITRETIAGTTAWQYAEGFGRVDTNVAILEPQADPMPARKPMTLEAMPLPESLAFADDAPGIESLSMVSTNDDGTGVLIVASAKRPNGGVGQEQPDLADTGCAVADGTSLAALSMTSGPPSRRTMGNVCVASEYCVRNPSTLVTLPECRLTALPAAGVRVAADGEAVWTARRWNGGIEPIGLQKYGGQDWDVKNLLGTWPLVALRGGDGRGAMAHIGPAVYPQTLLDSLYVSTAQYFGEQVNPPYGRVILQTWPNLQKLDTLVSLGEDAQGREQLLLRDADHFVTWSRSEGDVFSHPRVGGRIGGRLSVNAKRVKNDVLVVSGDGSVDRLALEADELVTYHLADVAIPAGEWAIGAFAVGGRLVIGTLRLGTVNNFGKNVHLSLYRTKESPGEGTRVPIPQALTIVSKRVAAGIQAVCWRDNGQAVDPSTWTANRKAPSFAGAVTAAGADPCIVVGQLDGELDRGVREGVVPGVGRVVVSAASAKAPPSGLDASPVRNFTVLADGSFIAPRRRLGRGGLDLGFPVGMTPESRQGPQSGMPDLGGAGYWALNGTPATLSLIDATGSRPISGVPAGGTLRGQLSPTGVVVESGGGLYFVTPTAATLVPTDATHSPCWLKRDGAICGVLSSGSIYCTKNGTETTFPGAPGIGCGGMPVGPDRYATAVSFDTVLLVDLAAGVTTSVPVGNEYRRIGNGVDHHGRGFFTMGIRNENYLSLVVPTETGLQEIHRIPAKVATADNTLSTPNSASFLSTPDILVLDITWTSGDALRYVLPPITPP